MQTVNSRILKLLGSHKKVLVYVCAKCNRAYSERDIPDKGCECGSVTYNKRMVTFTGD